jgi:hypothetical protein
MRATLQTVKKWVSTKYVRQGLFNNPSAADEKETLAGTWQDVVLVMSPEEAEALLRVLQVVQTHPEVVRVPDRRVNAGESMAAIPPVVSGTVVKGLEADLRRLKDGDEPVFEASPSAVPVPGTRQVVVLWRLTKAARQQAQAAEPKIEV